jgi:2-polyprenyl-3-methyl-5-hydroxy-6-metoxy-1,4-benzoquinol methylase
VSLVCPRCRGELRDGEKEAVCTSCGSRYARQDGILDLTAGKTGAPGFDPHYFDTLAEVEGTHFWFVVRRQIILDALRRGVPDLERRRLFDIGCGSGGLLEFLARQGVPVGGACDAYRESLEIVRRRIDAPLVLVDEGRLPPLAPGHTLLSLFDVLEHIDDDQGTLRFLRSVLEPGGALVLTVPAHPFLFDEMDELAHHRRRYRKRDLRELLEAAGFRVRVLTHFMSPLVPPLVAVRWVGRALFGRARGLQRRRAEFRVVPGLNGLLRHVLSVERLWIRLAPWLPVPFGSSLVAVAVRGDGS